MDLPVAAGENLPPRKDDVDVEQLFQRVTDASLSEKTRHKLLELVDCGMGGCISVLQVCLDHASSNAEELQDSELKQALLSDVFKYCLSKTYFGICFCEVLRPQAGTDNLLETVSDVLKLSESERFHVGLALLLSEEDTSYAQVEADGYFHLMFSDKMSVNDLIQVLSRFKESLKEREMSILNCMISNLFEKYKHFPDYPEKKLKLAATLFGSLIKHQLVDDLRMSVALRAVIDGLREPADSRMFMFGATALEQFLDHLLHWPLYRSEILQISHLRETHSEMVSRIEGATEPKDFPRGISENARILYGPPKNLEKQVREMTAKYLMQCDPSEMQKHTSKLLKDLQLSENLILQEKQELFELKSQQCKYPYSKCQPDGFEKEFGHIIHELKMFPGTNDKKLKDMKNGLYEAKFAGDALLSRVKDVLERNKRVSKDAGVLVSGYYDYFGRLNTEMRWHSGAAKRIEEVCDLLSQYAPLFTELEGQISELNKKMADLSNEPNTLVKIWKDIGLLLKEVVSQTKSSEDLCLVSKNLRTLLSEKATYADRFYLTEQRLRAESSKVHKKLVQLCHEVEEAEISYKEKMNGLEKASEGPKKYEKAIIENAMSWRKRKLFERSILAPMREQGRAMCAFVSTVSMTESLNKRQSAYCSRYSNSRYREDEFIIKLSEHHLQHIVTTFYANNKRKGSEKLDVCLERMRETGVVSEEAYDIATTKATGFTRYRISDFERLNRTRVEEAFDLLENGKVLIGTFAITKGYFSLGPEDVYNTNNGDVFETNALGNTLTHAVVIVGYGVTPNDTAYYVFQNSYGPTWCLDGFARVTCDSIRQLYTANL